eukprot:3677669-Amphidinium_carterae.1
MKSAKWSGKRPSKKKQKRAKTRPNNLTAKEKAVIKDKKVKLCQEAIGCNRGEVTSKIEETKAWLQGKTSLAKLQARGNNGCR